MTRKEVEAIASAAELLTAGVHEEVQARMLRRMGYTEGVDYTQAVSNASVCLRRFIDEAEMKDLLAIVFNQAIEIEQLRVEVERLRTMHATIGGQTYA